MARRVVWYGMAAVFPAAVAAASVGPFRCGLYGCMGGSNPTLHTFLLGAAIGAAIGLVGMFLIDISVNGRYFLTNRAETRAQRLRDASAGPNGPAPRDVRSGDTSSKQWLPEGEEEPPGES